MPIYDFKCKSCGHQFETISKFENNVPCEKCLNETERLVSAPMVVFKGHGWCTPSSDQKLWNQIPDNIKNMSEAELDKDLGLT